MIYGYSNNKIGINFTNFNKKKFSKGAHLVIKTKLKSYIFTNNELKNSLRIFSKNNKSNQGISDYSYEYKNLNKTKNDLEKRLLIVNKTIVFPANLVVSITTNSFDVIHSWFVPGLGIKMDCVPGRSTHHTFIFNIIGIYFGQCAEICGRFHHHMPISAAVLHFEMFMLWWHNIYIKKYYKHK